MTTEERRAIVSQRLEETDKLEPQVSITLRGNNYTLEFTNRQVKNLLKITGVNLLSDPAKYDDPEFLSHLLHQGLLKHHSDITQDTVDDLLTARNRVYVVTKLSKALSLFLPDTTDLPPVDERGNVIEMKPVLDPPRLLRTSGSAIGQSDEDADFLGASSGTAP